MVATRPSARLSLLRPVGPFGHLLSRATPDSPEPAAPLSTRRKMSLETLFLLRAIDQKESPSVKRLLPTPTAGLLLAPRPAEVALGALSPASWCGQRTPGRVCPCLPGR